jgi:hypothetical protein
MKQTGGETEGGMEGGTDVSISESNGRLEGNMRHGRRTGQGKTRHARMAIEGWRVYMTKRALAMIHDNRKIVYDTRSSGARHSSEYHTRQVGVEYWQKASIRPEPRQTHHTVGKDIV